MGNKFKQVKVHVPRNRMAVRNGFANANRKRRLGTGIRGKSCLGARRHEPVRTQIGRASATFLVVFWGFCPHSTSPCGAFSGQSRRVPLLRASRRQETANRCADQTDSLMQPEQG